jgi:uncharacterized protein
MGHRTSYPPGVFNWVELSTTDLDAAKRFYGALFGWTAEDEAVPDQDGGGVHTVLRLDGDEVAGLQAQPETQREAGVPPHWLSCVAVADADATAARAAELGGTVLTTYAVMTRARMTILADPAGAFFGAWQAGDRFGATRVNDPGCLTNNELSTDDVDRASDFYRGLFGWRIEEVDTGGGPRYWSIRQEGAAGGGLNGGARELAPDGSAGAPHWMPYFTVADLDAAVQSATTAGGAVLAPPMAIGPSARIAVLGDPQGAGFALFEGPVDD